MKKVIGLLLAVFVLTGVALADPVPSVSQDPCNYAVKKSVAIAISSATTTRLVVGSPGLAIYVCGFQDVFTQGTAGTMQLEYGTGSACAGGLTAATGVYTNPTTVTVQNTVVYPPSDMTGLFVPVDATTGNSLCALSTGTDVQAGVVTFVQQ